MDIDLDPPIAAYFLHCLGIGVLCLPLYSCRNLLYTGARWEY